MQKSTYLVGFLLLFLAVQIENNERRGNMQEMI